MSTSQDGRLELDELGSVIDDAAELGDASETLGDADGAPTIGQRLAGSGLGAWADRHRGLVRTGAVVAAVAGVAFLVRTATAPPPPSPDVIATVAPDLNAEDGGLELSTGAGVLTSVWTVSDVRTGETVRVVGVTGPGVRTSSARTVGPATDGIQKWAVSGLLGCEGTDVTADEPVDAAATTPYSLDLERTDTWGRVATASVPFPPGSSDWGSLVSQVCWSDETALGLHVDELAVRADTSRAVVTLGLDLSSTLDMPVLVGVAADSQPTVDIGRSFLAPLEARSSTQLDATVRITSCDGVQPPLVMADPRVSGGALLPGIPLAVQAARDSRNAIVPVVLDASQQAQVQDAIDQVCAGAPRVSASVVDVRRSAIPPSNGVIGTSAAVLLEVELQVTSSVDGAATVTLSYGGQQFPTRDSMVRAPVRADSADGADVVVFYEIQCAATPAPPRLSVVVDADGRARPWSRVLDDARLERAILDACGGLTPEMLVTSGWPRPAR